MASARYLFPAIYIVFLLPSASGAPIEAKIVALVASAALAFLINARSIMGVARLLLMASFTLVPFLFFVQSAVCSSLTVPSSSPFLPCVTQKSVAVLLNVGLLSSAFLLAVANEWRGSLVATINGLFLPQNVRIMAVIAGAMIGEFRRATLKVHHAFTSCGKAMPAAHWRNLIVLPSMLGVVWASVLDGTVERIKGQWSSDDFWRRYVPQRQNAHVRASIPDLAVLGAAGLVGASFFSKFRLLWHVDSSSWFQFFR